MMEQLTSKKSFFAALDQLDEPDEDEPSKSKGHVASPATGLGANFGPEKVALSSGHQRVIPSREDSKTRPSCDIQSKSKRTAPPSAPKPVPLSSPEATRIMPTSKIEGTPRKRRKPNNPKIIPEDQQIFKGLVFYFFPNNEISPFRRLRIQRAQEYGARWSREWAADVTHAIFDKNLQINDLRSYLKIKSLPAEIVIVNESYPSECIQFRSVLNHSQLRFRVDEAVSQHDESPVEQPSLDSLPLKSPLRVGNKPPDPPASPFKDVILESYQEELVVETVKGQAKEEDTHNGGWERDALDDIIDEAKATSHLPLDPIEPLDDGNAGDTDAETSSSEESHQRLKRPHKETKGNTDWAKGFACMQEFDPDLNDKNPNSSTIDILQQMLDYYTRNADQWRILAYRRAIAALRKQRTKVTNRVQARAIPGVGERLADKIEEIVMTNRLRRLDNANNTPEDLIIQEFLGVYGAGLPQASKWVAQGYKSLADLLEKASLTKQQRIGVERYNDFAQRIPRKEVELHGAIVRKAVQSVDKDMQVIIGGSYRRGAVTCGDVDCLITKPGATLEQIRTILLALVVPKLFNNGFLKAGLSISSHQDGSKWHGASALPGTDLWRRIDLLFVPDAEIGAALLYFTGNDIFNRSMRLLARKKGMCLNQRGLYTDVLRDGQTKLNPGRLLEGRDERRIFAVLGVPWRPPEHRIC